MSDYTENKNTTSLLAKEPDGYEVAPMIGSKAGLFKSYRFNYLLLAFEYEGHFHFYRDKDESSDSTATDIINAAKEVLPQENESSGIASKILSLGQSYVEKQLVPDHIYDWSEGYYSNGQLTYLEKIVVSEFYVQ